jgi:DNA-binding transcriptional ArsR family regulator
MEAMAALADPTRRQILELLRVGETSAGELGERFAISQPGVSRHLRVLRESGLVRVRVDGQRRLYALEPGPLAELDQWLEPFRNAWVQRLDALDTEIRRGRRTADRRSSLGTDPRSTQ